MQYVPAMNERVDFSYPLPSGEEPVHGAGGEGWNLYASHTLRADLKVGPYIKVFWAKPSPVMQRTALVATGSPS